MQDDNAYPFRQYGSPPFVLVLVHGGPGANGALKELALTLSETYSLLEPFQTKTSIAGQAAELAGLIQNVAKTPVALLGHSWGAWLSLITAATYPEWVRKLILVGCPPLEEQYAQVIAETRNQRWNALQRSRMAHLFGQFHHGAGDDQANFKELAALCAASDDYCPLALADDEAIDFRSDIYQSIWPEASEWRRKGILLENCRKVVCPISVIHGDYDPHPFTGVRDPLAAIGVQAVFHLLPRCGHDPWREKYARVKFLHLLLEELGSN